jgi:hypothetical protein
MFKSILSTSINAVTARPLSYSRQDISGYGDQRVNHKCFLPGTDWIRMAHYLAPLVTYLAAENSALPTLKNRRCSDWLRAARPTGQISSPDKVENCLFSMQSRPVLGPIQSPIQCLMGDSSTGVKGQGREAMRAHLYIHSLIRIHEVVLSAFIIMLLKLN